MSVASSSSPSPRSGSYEAGLNVHRPAGIALAGVFSVMVLAVLAYGIRVTAGTGARPPGQEAKRIERSVTIATVIELVAAFVLPVIVIAAGHSDWVLPSIAITIGPLLLWLDHLVHIPRYRPVGWALIVGPVILVATMSGTALVGHHGYRRRGAALGDGRRRLPRPRRPSSSWPVRLRHSSARRHHDRLPTLLQPCHGRMDRVHGAG